MLSRSRIAVGLSAASAVSACGGRLSAHPPSGQFIGTTVSQTLSGDGLSWLAILLAGVVLGLAIAHVWRKWAVRRALRRNHGLALGREISRLESAIRIIDDLLVNWPRRAKVVDLLRRLKKRNRR